MILEPFRWVVGRGVLGYEKLTREPPKERSSEAQAAIDEKTKNIVLYEFLACPFCMKVRKVMHKNALHLERRDARRNQVWKEELIKQGGRFQTPCLKITDAEGNDQWMYESSDIIEYLEKAFPE